MVCLDEETWNSFIEKVEKQYNMKVGPVPTPKLEEVRQEILDSGEFFCEHGIRKDIECFMCIEMEEGNILASLSRIIGSIEYRLEKLENEIDELKRPIVHINASDFEKIIKHEKGYEVE